MVWCGEIAMVWNGELAMVWNGELAMVWCAWSCLLGAGEVGGSSRFRGGG
jgi:hypothetical protein